MKRNLALWRANVIVFIASFCVMVIEIISARMLAPYIGVSLYTWTSIIGVILAGIALGNYIGGKIADKFASPQILAIIFLGGCLATVAILPTIIITSQMWFNNLPAILNFVIKVVCVFFLPAIILSMVSPMVIKLTLADLGKTGGIVGTIYAVSTAGAILGTFMTGFYLIMWFGTRSIVWILAGILLLTAIVAWFSWKVPRRWRVSPINLTMWILSVTVIISSGVLFQFKTAWEDNFLTESNYYTFQVWDNNGAKVLVLDHIIHGAVVPDDPKNLQYPYLQMFAESVAYVTSNNQTPSTLVLGGGAYCFPRYMEATYPGSKNDVVEIDPVVTQVAYEQLGLPRDTTIKTYNEDARLFLMQQKPLEKYDIVVCDCFNDSSVPYHLATLEFDKIVKEHLTEDGIYLVHVVDNYKDGRFMPSCIDTLSKAFNHVYLMGTMQDILFEQTSGFVILASDRPIDTNQYHDFVNAYAKQEGYSYPVGDLLSDKSLNDYMSNKNPILLTDDHVPTDILISNAILK